MRFPPFIIAQNAVSVCNGVTVMDCPKPMRARSPCFTSFSGIMMPEDSPDRSTPVLLPNPKFLI